jgi:hypothetical protein
VGAGAATSKWSSKALAFPHPRLAPGSPLDIYLFLHEAGAPTAADLATQYSALVPHGSGAWSGLSSSGSGSSEPLDLSASAYDALLRDPMHTAIYAGSAAEGRLPAVKWRNITIADWTLARDVDVTIELSENVRLHNGSIWADVFAVPADAQLREMANREEVATMRMRRRESHRGFCPPPPHRAAAWLSFAACILC